MWFHRLALAAGLSLLAGSSIAIAATPAKTIIANQALLSYTGLHDTAYTTVSNEVKTTVTAVSGLTLIPNENGCSNAADTFLIDAPLVKTFALTNGGNEPDAFAISSATVTAGKITAVEFIIANNHYPAMTLTSTSGGTMTAIVSPIVAPGASLQIVVTIDASRVVAGTEIIARVTARSTMTGTSNGTSSAIAAQCGVAATPAIITGLGGTGTVPAKLVNGLPATQANPRDTVTYSIALTNSGGEPATNVAVIDPLPADISYVAGSAKINGAPAASANVTIAGQTITIALGSVAIRQPMTVTFNATVSAQAYDGQSLVNIATATASNATSKKTNPAAVLVGIANTIFDGDTGAKSPISAASVEIAPYTGPAGHPSGPVTLAGLAVAPNAKNANPYTTDTTGTYSLGLAPKQTGTYQIIVTASGYVSRNIKLDLTADATGTYYTAVLTALDGQPLAAVGTFDLSTASTITIPATYAIFGNIPMFRTGNVTLTKTVDRSSASAGSRLIYTLTVANGASPLAATTVTDSLPSGIAYAPGTSRVDGIAVEPDHQASRLTWTFAQLTKQHVITFAAVILPSVADESILTNVAIADAHVATSATFTVSARATATTNVIAGIFTNRTIITGRVYVDRDGSGRYTRNDIGVPGVRIYLEDGESVTTDANGKYNFPSARPGMHILRLDQTSLPPIVAVYDDRRIDSERSVRRLVHDIYDGGLLQDMNFALKSQP